MIAGTVSVIAAAIIAAAAILVCRFKRLACFVTKTDKSASEIEASEAGLNMDTHSEQPEFSDPLFEFDKHDPFLSVMEESSD